jgi:hypothetical protein
MARSCKTVEPVTMGHIRGHGCRDLLVYCVSPWCNHSASPNGDSLPDDTGGDFAERLERAIERSAVAAVSAREHPARELRPTLRRRA